MGDPETSWGGSSLFGQCELYELVELFRQLRKLNSSIYLHDSDCRLFTPDSLLSFESNLSSSD